VGSLVAVVPACTADVHDNTLTIEEPKVAFTTDVDVDNVQPGSSVRVKIDAGNVYPVEPEQTPPPEHKDDAVYFKIFLDDVDSEPLVVTARGSVDVKISSDVEPGRHKLICRMFKHDGTPTSSMFDISIQVKASGAVTTEPETYGG
jgi:hypothetical protein